VPDGDAVVATINPMMADFSTVVFTQDWHPANHLSFASQHADHEPFAITDMPYGPQTLWPDHCIQGSTGAEFHPELTTSAAQLVIRKGFRQAIDSYSAFQENDKATTTGLAGYLNARGITRVFCVGLALDYCVRFSAEDARAAGFETVVLENACRGINLDGSVAAARQALQTAGVVMTSAS